MIDHKSSIPLYQQLTQILENNIKEGKYESEKKLPSESQLCKIYDVSRITVRQALAILEKKNIVHSVPGKGTFLTEFSISQKLLKIISFKQTLEESGLKGYTIVKNLDENIIKNEKIQKFFQNTDILSKLTLIGYIQEEPLVMYESYLEKDIISKIYNVAKNYEKENIPFSTYDILKEEGYFISEVQQKITAINANSFISKNLNIKEGTAILTLETFTYTENNKLLEYKIAYYRGDKYSFTIKRELN